RPMTDSSDMGKRLLSPSRAIRSPPTPAKRTSSAASTRSATINRAPSASPDGSPATSTTSGAAVVIAIAFAFAGAPPRDASGRMVLYMRQTTHEADDALARAQGAGGR